MNIEVNVNAGACGFKSLIKASSQDKRNSVIEFTTDCPSLKILETELKTADAYKEVFSKFGTSNVFQVYAKHCKHAACPVPTALIKAIEASCGLALPRTVTIEIKKVEEAPA